MPQVFEVRDGASTVGSFSGDQIRELAADGTLNAGMQIRRLPDGAWSSLSNVKGLRFRSPAATNAAAAVAQSAPTNERGQRNKVVVLFACSAGAITFAVAGALLFRELSRDRWEALHAGDCIQRLDEAEKMRQTNPLAAYRIYEAVLTEASVHQLTDADFKAQLSAAAEAKSTLYPLIEPMIKAQEAEQQRIAAEQERLADEKRRQAEAEQKRIADEGRRQAEEAERAKKLAATVRERLGFYDSTDGYISRPGRHALDSLKKLEARVQVEVTYEQYRDLVGEAWGDVRVFVESPKGQKVVEFSGALTNAIEHYKSALEAWQRKLRTSNPVSALAWGQVLQDSWREASAAIELASNLQDDKQREAALRQFHSDNKLSTYERDAFNEADIAKAAMERGDYRSAHEHLDASIAAKSTPIAYVMMVGVLMAEGRTSDADGWVIAAVELYPDNKQLADVKRLFDEKRQLESVKRSIETGLQIVAFDLQRAQHDGNVTQEYRDRLKRAVEGSKYWKSRSVAERDAYIAAAQSRDASSIICEVVTREALDLAYAIPADTGEQIVRETLAKVAPLLKASTRGNQRDNETGGGRVNPSGAQIERPKQEEAAQDARIETGDVRGAAKVASGKAIADAIAKSRAAWEAELKASRAEAARLKEEAETRKAEVGDLGEKLERLEKAGRSTDKMEKVLSNARTKVIQAEQRIAKIEYRLRRAEAQLGYLNAGVLVAGPDEVADDDADPSGSGFSGFDSIQEKRSRSKTRKGTSR